MYFVHSFLHSFIYSFVRKYNICTYDSVYSWSRHFYPPQVVKVQFSENWKEWQAKTYAGISQTISDCLPVSFSFSIIFPVAMTFNVPARPVHDINLTEIRTEFINIIFISYFRVIMTVTASLINAMVLLHCDRAPELSQFPN